MGITKKISSLNVIERMKRFRIQNSNWKYDAIDWIGEGIRIMGFGCGVESRTRIVNISNFKGVIPANIEVLNYVTHNGIRIPISYDNTASGLISNTISTVNITYLESLEINKLIDLLSDQEEIYASNPTQELLEAVKETKDKINKAVKDATVLGQTKSYRGDWYSLEEGIIKTSFESGEISINGIYIPVCERGFPLILDNEKYLMALEWFCVYNLLLQGYQHPTIKDWREAYTMWENLYPAAQNDNIDMSIDMMDRFVNTWNSIKKDITQTTTDF